MTDTTPPHVLTHTPLHVYPEAVNGVELLFSEYLDPDSFTADDLLILDPSHTVITPTGIQALTDRVWHVTFPTQTAPGVYHLYVESDVADLNGFRLDQDRDGLPGEPVDDAYDAQFTLGSTSTYITSSNPSHEIGQQFGLTNVIVNFSQPIHFQTFTASDVTVTTPYGEIVSPTDVVQLSSTSYRVDVPHQDALGTYTFTINLDITDLNGNPVGLGQDGVQLLTVNPVVKIDKSIVDFIGPRVTSQYPDPVWGTSDPVSSILVAFDEDIDASTFTKTDVFLAGPNNVIIPVTSVTAMDSRHFKIHFAEQQTNGKYLFAVGPNVNDVNGNAMDQNGNWVNGEYDDHYIGKFDQYGADLVVMGVVTYSNYLKDYFPNAHVAVQLWEQNGAKDPTPGIPNPGDEADVFISDQNELSGKALGEWGNDMTTSKGEFLFSVDKDGNWIPNADTSASEPEKSSLPDFYVAVLAKNKYAMATNHTKPQRDTAHPTNRFYQPFYPAGEGNKPPKSPEYPDIWEEVHYETTAVTEPADAQSTTVIIDPQVTKDEFGLAEWIYYGATWIETHIGQPAREFIAVSAPDGANNGGLTRSGYIWMGQAKNRIATHNSPRVWPCRAPGPERHEVLPVRGGQLWCHPARRVSDDHPGRRLGLLFPGLDAEGPGRGGL